MLSVIISSFPEVRQRLYVVGHQLLFEARALSDRSILCGGMTANEQKWSGPRTAERIDRFVRDFFSSLGDRRRFLFATGCNHAPHTPCEDLIALRDAAVRPRTRPADLLCGATRCARRPTPLRSFVRLAQWVSKAYPKLN